MNVQYVVGREITLASTFGESLTASQWFHLTLSNSSLGQGASSNSWQGSPTAWLQLANPCNPAGKSS